jgi:hypothetical protein
MRRKKDEPKKQKILLRETKQKAKVESEKTELQEKIDRLVQSLWKRISDPIDTYVNPEQRLKKLIFLNNIYFEFSKTHDAFRLTQGTQEYKGKFKDLLKNNIRKYLPTWDNIQDHKKLFTKLFLDFPDDLLNSVFSFFLSLKWDPIRDPRDIPILFELLFFYYEHIEERLPPSLVYQMDIAAMQLIWEAMIDIRQMDKKGRVIDRTTPSTKTRKSETYRRSKLIITLFDQIKDKRGLESIGQMTLNKIATLIQTISRKSSQDKKNQVSINTVKKTLVEHFDSLKQTPPWKPINKKFIKT